MSHLNKNIHSHHSINNNNLRNIKSVLDQIQENTDSLEINTDGLETPLNSIDNKTADLKTFTFNQDPSESVVSGTPVNKSFVVIGGCDQVNTSFDEINPLKVDSSGNLTINGISQAQGDATHPDTAYKQKIYVGLHDVSNNLIRTATCDSSANLNVNIASGGSTADATAANQLTTHSKLDTIETTLNDIETNTDKITQGYDATISSGGNGLFQVVAYGRDQSGNLDALNVDNNGHLKIAVDTVENKGTFGNIQNGTLNFGSTSSTVDVSDFNHSVILYEDANTSTFDNPVLEISMDNSNFYKSTTSISPVVRGSKREATVELKLHGITHVRIKNESVADNFTTCKCTVVGTPN